MKRIREMCRRGHAARQAFREHKACMREVYSLAERVLRTPPGTPREYCVRMGRIPARFYSLRKNLFSLLFMSSYLLLDIDHERRMLYGKLNHLFRVWVTGADNLLDQEDKVVIPLRIGGDSRVMREVVAIMTADRVLNRILADATADGVITREEARLLSDGSLQVLLPSAAQEAGEEAGVEMRPEPEYVFNTVHHYKTGLLFHIPLLGPESIERDIDPQTLRLIKSGFMKFGLGCQLLDDIRDVRRDLRERRHNYVLSLLFHKFPEKYAALTMVADDDRLYHRIPEAVLPTARRGLDSMRQGLLDLDRAGMGLGETGSDYVAANMFKVLDLGDLRYV